MLSPSGNDVFTIAQFLCSATGQARHLIRSPDEGTTWYSAWPDINRQISGPAGGEDFLTFALAASSVLPRRLYISGFPDIGLGGAYMPSVLRSDDGGAHWQATADDPQIDGKLMDTFSPESLVTDPVGKGTVYLELAPMNDHGVAASDWARSEDAGETWHFVRAPATQPHTNFNLYTDPHLPQRIVAQLTGKGIPADRRYVSADHGRTWKGINCPGDLHGECPAYTLDNVFGDGYAYGFFKDGVHAFTGAGPAGPRLALSNRLPCKTSALIDVGGGHTAGAPAYLLCQDPAVPLATPPAGEHWTLDQNPSLSGILYRSTDGGKTWQQLHPATAH
jgi:hypothetical protein